MTTYEQSLINVERIREYNEAKRKGNKHIKKIKVEKPKESKPNKPFPNVEDASKD